MEFLLVVMIVLNMVQLNKDAARCRKADYKEAGCTIFKKTLSKDK